MRDSLEFVGLAESHLPMLHRWLNEDPVLRWYAREPQSLAQVEEQCRARIEASVPTRGFVLQGEGESAGYWHGRRPRPRKPGVHSISRTCGIRSAPNR